MSNVLNNDKLLENGEKLFIDTANKSCINGKNLIKNWKVSQESTKFLNKIANNNEKFVMFRRKDSAEKGDWGTFYSYSILFQKKGKKWKLTDSLSNMVTCSTTQDVFNSSSLLPNILEFHEELSLLNQIDKGQKPFNTQYIACPDKNVAKAFNNPNIIFGCTIPLKDF